MTDDLDPTLVPDDQVDPNAEDATAPADDAAPADPAPATPDVENDVVEG